MQPIITEEDKMKAKKAQSPEDILAIAERKGIEISPEEAAVYFDVMSKYGKLSDEELENVTGGMMPINSSWCVGVSKCPKDGHSLDRAGRKVCDKCPFIETRTVGYDFQIWCTYDPRVNK